jgi:glycosyltransferase involved in cell wall biosynthesis
VVTVVMPCYNEGDILEGTVRDWHALVERIPGGRLLIVDDASTDDTPVILDGLKAELPRLDVVRAPANRGHGPTVVDGLQRAATEFVFHADSDQQIPSEEFWQLWELRDDADFVLGVRRNRADGAFRKVISTGARTVNVLLWRVHLRDANCPFKLMRREPLAKILVDLPDGLFAPMIAIAVLARVRGHRVVEVPVTHLPRTGGTQSLAGVVKWARTVQRCLAEAWSIRSHR